VDKVINLIAEVMMQTQYIALLREGVVIALVVLNVMRVPQVVLVTLCRMEIIVIRVSWGDVSIAWQTHLLLVV